MDKRIAYSVIALIYSAITLVAAVAVLSGAALLEWLFGTYYMFDLVGSCIGFIGFVAYLMTYTSLLALALCLIPWRQI